MALGDPRVSSSQPKLALRQLGKVFDVQGVKKVALHDIDLDVQSGEFVAIVGASGCGKSTLIRIVAGLEAASSGEVLIEGKPVKRPGNDRGMVFQKFSLFPWLTVLGNVMFGLQDQFREKKDRAKAALELSLIHI